MPAAPDLIAPDELADMMESPDFAALPAFERAQMFDAGLEESRAWLKTNAGDDEALSKAFDETAQAMAVKYRPAESDIKMSQAEVNKPFFRLGDAASGVADAVGGLTTTLPAAYYRLSEGFQRPDKYSPSARAAFDEEASYAKQMQDESAARLMKGEASSTGDAFRSVGPSLGFSAATMAAAVPAGMAGAKIGAAGGAAAGAGVGAFFAGVGAVPGAAIGSTVGSTVGGLGAGMTAAGTAAYRMAGAQFLDDAFNAWLAKNPKADEAAREDAYQQLLPLAQNSALWEAGPEAIGTVVGMGAGKVVLGLGKQTLTSLAKTALGKAGIKAGALAGGVGTELVTETATQVGQGLPMAQAEKFAARQPISQANNPYDVPGGTMQAFKDVAPQTLALSGLMLGMGGAVKGAGSLRGNPSDQSSPAPMPASGQAVSPLGDIAAGTFVPDAPPLNTPASVPEFNGAANIQQTPVQRTPILGNVPDGGRRMPGFQDDPLGATAPGGGGNVLRDFGIAKSPNAQAVADAAEVERQRQVAGMQTLNGKRAMPVIPDSPLGVLDILDYLNETPLRVARKGSEDAGNAENDWSERFNVPMYYRKFIASSERGYEPSTVADNLYKEGVISEPTVDAMMAKVQRTISERTQYRVQFRQRDKALKQEAQQVSSFERDQARAGDRDKTLVALDDVAPGDEMLINGEKAVVRKIDYDEDGYLTNVVIEDGKRYGVLSLDPTTRAGVFVDEYQPRQREQAAPDFEDPFTMQSMSEEELAAEKARAKQRADLAERQSATLKGDAGEYGTPDMLDSTAGDMALFSQAGSATSPDARVPATSESPGLAGVQPAGETVQPEGRKGFTNTAITQDLEAGFMSDAGIDALFDLANAAITAGKSFVQWSAEMVKRFGETIREYLAHVWAVAKDTLPTTAAQNVRLGGPAKSGQVRLSQSGAVLNPFNLLTSLKGGTKVFHAKGEPFRVNYLGARELLTGSPLPAELVPVLTRTNQEKRALEQRAAQLGMDLQSALDAYVDKSGLPPEQVNEQVAAMMGGDVQTAALLAAVAPVLHERTRAVRVLLDNLSAAVGQTLPAGPLRTTIMSNLGAWLRRSYAAFDPASGWNYDALLRAAAAGTLVNGKDAQKILNDARAYLMQQQPGATGKDIEADLRDLMDRDVWEGALTGGGARKNVSSLMKRKDIAPEIRAVMGEEQNPVKLLTSSASFQAQFIARHHGQVAMRNAGLATGLFSADRGGVYTEQVPTEQKWSGMAGVWTTPQMMKALENSSGVIKEGSDLGGLMVSTLKALGNKAKLNRVALNPDSWMVNILGNFTSLIQNGDVFAWNIINRVQKAREITGAGDAKTGAVVNAAAEALQDASRDMQARLTEAGVLGSSLTLADLEASLPRHLLQWLALDQKADRMAGALEGAIVGQGMGRGLGMPGRAVGGAIGAAAGALAGGTKIQAWQMKVADFLMSKPDALARTTGWLTNYESALASGMAPDAAATWATTRTLNTFPNYAALPGLMREASKLGIMGSFIAFQHEVYRNFGWNVRYATEELSSGNAAMMQRGLQRLAGIGAIAAMAGGGLAALLAATGAAGGDDERNKLFRKWFGAPWEKDAVLAFREFDGEKVSYFNTSYLLPQTTMMELMQAMREGENPADAAGRVVNRLYEQFIGGSVHLGPLLSATMNQKRSGAKLTYQTGVAGAAERLDEPLKTILEPGFAEKIERLTYAVREAERNGTKYSIEQEFRRIIGLRETTKTWPKMVEGVYRSLADENANIRAQANREVSLNRPGASKRAVDAANAQIDTLRQKVADFERDAVKLGVPEQVIIRAKREASVGKLPSVGLQADGKRVISLGR